MSGTYADAVNDDEHYFIEPLYLPLSAGWRTVGEPELSAMSIAARGQRGRGE